MQEATVKLVIGKRGSGKTVKAMNLIKDEPRVIIFDTLCHDYSDGVIFYDLNRLKLFWQTVYKNNFRIIYRPVEDVETDFATLCMLSYFCGNLCFLAEEVHLFCRPNTRFPEFQKLIQVGRHQNVSFVGVTQRPFGIDRLLTSQAKEIYVFNTNEPRDKSYLKDLLGEESAEKIPLLKQYEYLRWVDGDNEVTISKDSYRD